MAIFSRIGNYLSLIKFSHTIFALPFALLGFFLAVLDAGELELRDLLLVVLCMVFARSAAMAAAATDSPRKERRVGVLVIMKSFVGGLLGWRGRWW